MEKDLKKTYEYKNLTINVTREYKGVQPLNEILYNMILRDIKLYEMANCA